MGCISSEPVPVEVQVANNAKSTQYTPYVSNDSRVYMIKKAVTVKDKHKWTDDKKDELETDKHSENRKLIDSMTHNFNIRQIICYWIRNIDDEQSQSFKLSLYILNNDILGLLCKYSVRSYLYMFGYGLKQINTPSIIHNQLFVQKGNLYLLNIKQQIIKHDGNHLYGQSNIDKLIHGMQNERDFDEILFSNGLSSEHCFIMKNNKLFALGRNHYGQLGIMKKSFCEQNPIELNTNFDSKIMQIKCGYEHSIFLTVGGKIYSCGHNKNGQLGLGDSIDKTYKIEQIMEFDGRKDYKAEEIECSRMTSFVVIDGILFAFGSNDCGLLAIGSDNPCLNKYKPYKIIPGWFGYCGITKIECGICHICILNDNYDAFVWGQALSIGIGKKVGIQNRPKGLLRNIKSIACGDFHTILQTFDDDLYVFGKNNRKQLFGLSDKEILKPKFIEKKNILMYEQKSYITKDIDYCQYHIFAATETTLIAIE